ACSGLRWACTSSSSCWRSGTRCIGPHDSNGRPVAASTSAMAWAGSSSTRVSSPKKSSRNAASRWVVFRVPALPDTVSKIMFCLPSQRLCALPCRGARPTDEDVEHLTTCLAEGGKLGQVQPVREPHRSPATAEERRETLRRALPGTVRVEDAIDGQRLVQR